MNALDIMKSPDIPAGVIAAGVPCKVIRPITEKDKFKPEDILF